MILLPPARNLCLHCPSERTPPPTTRGNRTARLGAVGDWESREHSREWESRGSCGNGNQEDYVGMGIKRIMWEWESRGLCGNGNQEDYVGFTGMGIERTLILESQEWE